MSMQSAWVDEIFGRLTVRYGRSFLDQYGDAPIPLVKADWANLLSGITYDGVKYGLGMGGERPPNAVQFRARCICMPSPTPQALERPHIKADKPRLAALLAKLQKPKDGDQRVILRKRLEALEEAKTISAAQKAALGDLRSRHLGVDTGPVQGAFKPIPPSEWPWNKAAVQDTFRADHTDDPRFAAWEAKA